MRRLLPILLFAPLLAAQDYEIFLLIGQSNMAGRGVVEDQDRQPIEGVYMLDAQQAWKPAVDPMHYDKPAIAGVGLGRSFGKTLRAANPYRRIGLVPAAMGGSALDEWKTDGPLYKNAVDRAKAAMKTGRLRGILWHQGESDSNTEDKARSYRERWTAFIGQLRSDIGDVPVVVGQLGEFLYTRPEKPQLISRIVNEQLALLPLYVPRVAFVSSQGLQHKGDGVHFDSAGLRELGRRYALAYLSLDATWSK